LDETTLCFPNGALDVLTGDFTTTKDAVFPIGFTTRSILANYRVDHKPERDLVEWFKFLDSIGFEEGSDERLLLQHWFGYLLLNENTLHKALLMCGPPRAGKGVILQIIHEMFNAKSTTLEDLSERFGLWPIKDSSVITIGDLRVGSLRGNSRVIQRVLELTGGDTLGVEKKGGDTLSMRLPGRLMMATNETPDFGDFNAALPARLVVLPFTRSFLGSEDLNLMDRLLSELSGIASWALAGLFDLQSRDWKFVEPALAVDIREEMSAASNPVEHFVTEELINDETADETTAEWTATRELYDHYRAWSDSQGYRNPMHMTMFSKRLRAVLGRKRAVRRRLPGSGRKSSPVNGFSGVEPDTSTRVYKSMAGGGWSPH
jgi:putative DNA primase/helicase